MSYTPEVHARTLHTQCPIAMNAAVLFLHLPIILLIGCGPSPEETGTSTEEQDTHGATAAPVITADRGVKGVELDQGRRWLANAETTAGIAVMRGLLEGHPGNGIAGMDLKDTLEAEFALIFERCTMTGEAHEQLHNYLLPLNRLLRDLPQDAPPAAREAILAYLKEYDTFFE